MYTSKKKGYPMVHSDPNISSCSSSTASAVDRDDFIPRNSCVSALDPTAGGGLSPIMMSPWNQPSPFAKSPWSNVSDTTQTGLIGSLVREEGHIYSLAAKDRILYTGSDSKNIRVWKNMQEFSAFKSNSGLVKAIIISGDRIFTGHQDGKIRVWKVSPKSANVYKRVGTMPTFFDIFKASIRPKNYVEVKRNRTVWIKHADAISCLTMDQTTGLLYSGSWDKSFKVWRVETSKCIESVAAHDDAVNSVVTAADGFVYTGAADGSVKVWKREQSGNVVNHKLMQTLLSQENAVTALAVNATGVVLYCGASDGLVNFWLYEKHQLTHGGVLRGHKLAVLCLAAAGNNMVLSGSADKTICVWRRDGAAHSCLSVLTGHTGPVKCLAVEEDKEAATGGGEGKWVIYSGSLDKSVKVWSVSETMPDFRGDNNNYNW